MSGTTIEIRTEDGVCDAYLFPPPGGQHGPGVLLYMDALGVRPGMREMAERLASNGYTVLLPNLYYRSGPYGPFDPGTVFQDEAERGRLMGMVRSIDNDRVMRDTGAFLDFLAGQESVAGAKFGCDGYCMGGHYALVAAGTFPDRVVAAASFHGGNLATDRPDSPHLLADRMRATLYVGVAGIDPHFPPEEKDRLEAALSAAGVPHTIEVYPNVRHGFAVPDLPVYDRAAAEKHWERLLELLREAVP